MRGVIATFVAAAAVYGIIMRVQKAVANNAVVHPDQIFQGVEQAHILQYGYGATPLEYTPPIAMRSHIVPLAYSYILGAASSLGASYVQVQPTSVRHHHTYFDLFKCFLHTGTHNSPGRTRFTEWQPCFVGILVRERTDR